MLNKYKGIKKKEWGVKYLGDCMDDRKRIGYYFIDVLIEDIFIEVINLFFIFSVWNVLIIFRYLNLSLSFYEKLILEVNLCSIMFIYVFDYFVVIMCFFLCMRNGWVVYENG